MGFLKLASVYYLLQDLKPDYYDKILDCFQRKFYFLKVLTHLKKYFKRREYLKLLFHYPLFFKHYWINYDQYKLQCPRLKHFSQDHHLVLLVIIFLHLNYLYFLILMFMNDLPNPFSIQVHHLIGCRLIHNSYNFIIINRHFFNHFQILYKN